MDDPDAALVERIADDQDRGRSLERAGQPAEALAHLLRATQLAAQVLERTAIRPETLVSVFDDAARLAYRQGRAGLALELLGVGAGFADRDDRPYLLFRAVPIACHVLDIGGAADLLVLGLWGDGSQDRTRLADRTAVEQALDTLSTMASRMHGRWAVARRSAAAGRLDEAADAAEALLDALAGEAMSGLSPIEVAIFCAELHLDRGDWAAARRLVSRYGGADRRWQIIDADVDLATGRLSAVATRLSVLADTDDVLGPAAQLRRVHALTFLNRFDDALAAIESLPASEASRLEALVTLRRVGDTDAFDLPPSPFEIIDRSIPQPTSSDGRRVAPPPLDLERHHERAARDWSRIANEIRLALAAGLHERAAQGLAALAAWGVDGELVAAKLALLRALAAWRRGDLDAGLHACQDANERFTRLDMPLHCWAVSRVEMLLRGEASDPRRGAPEGRVDGADADRELAAAIERLDTHDRVDFVLNKWSSVVDAIDRICRGLPQDASSTRNAAVADRVLDWLSPDDEEEHGAAAKRIDPVHDPYGRARHRPRPHEVVRARARRLRFAHHRALAPDVGLLAFVSLPDRLEIFCATRREVLRIVRPSSRSAIRHAVARAQVFRRTCLGERKPGALSHLTALLGIDECLTRLPPAIRTLFVIPDDILMHVPYGALPVDDTLLVERFAVALLPRPRWVGWRPPRALRSALTVTAADAGLNAGLPRLDVSPDQAVFDELSGRICRLDGDAARRSDVLAALRECSAVHFGCHGRFDPLRPDRAGLLLHDGALSAADIAALDPPLPALVSIGACWGADISVLPAGIHVGLPAAFLARGTRCVLANLWPVEDSASAEMCRSWLVESIAGRDPIAALAQAQRRIARTHPMMDWAGFTLHVSGVAPRGLRGLYLQLVEWRTGRAWPLPWKTNQWRAPMRSRRGRPPVEPDRST